jgi:hypothetical protein
LPPDRNALAREVPIIGWAVIASTTCDRNVDDVVGGARAHRTASGAINSVSLATWSRLRTMKLRTNLVAALVATLMLVTTPACDAKKDDVKPAKVDDTKAAIADRPEKIGVACGPGKAGLATACKSALDAAEQATASMGCTW